MKRRQLEKAGTGRITMDSHLFFHQTRPESETDRPLDDEWRMVYPDILIVTSINRWLSLVSQFFIEMNCVSSARVRVGLLDGEIDARAEAKFWCDGGDDGDGGQISAEDDWDTWWIKARHDD